MTANSAKPASTALHGACDEFSQQMRLAAHETWSAAIDHRFFREVASDSVEDRVFERYLRVEYGFVDCAAIVLGYAIAKAPSFAERRRLSLGLHGLVMDQEGFFVAAFERLGTAASSRKGLPPNRQSSPLHDVFLDAARNESYEEILACILAAEWMYLTWCSSANRRPSSRGYIRDWVALHAGGAFAEHVAWVRSEIDARAPALPPDRQARLQSLFAEALLAEISFHDAAYAIS
jgi:thiaminase/transcriptional activator TenA